jgi:hypothetical protein
VRSVKTLLIAVVIATEPMSLKGYMAILKLDKHNEDKEIEFELDYLTSLTTRQRFELMFRKTKEMRNLLKRNECRKATEVIKRKPD